MLKRSRLLIIGYLAMCIAWPATATPLLSPDGSTVDGLAVDGGIYQVTFMDGIAVDVYGAIDFTPAYESLANLVTTALLEFLSSGSVAPTAIAGCEDSATCRILNPDTRIPGAAVFFRDTAFGEFAAGTWGVGGTVSIPENRDTGAVGAGVILTFVTFERTVQVPAPATGLMLALCLVPVLSRYGRTNSPR